MQEKSKDSNGISRSRKSKKDRQWQQQRNRKKDKQWFTIHYTESKDWATRTPLKPGCAPEM